MKNLVLVIAIFGLGMAFGQKNVESFTVKTSAECGMCKDKIEEALNYTKGVKYAELIVETKMLTVKYKTDKISKAEIIKIVNMLGYDADGKEADEKAYSELPKCCLKGAHSKEK